MSHDAGAACACVSEHRPPVLEFESHHVWPLYLAGPDDPTNRVWLCSTAHGNVHELLRLMVGAGRTLTDTEMQAVEDRPVSRYAAALARTGYTMWRASQAEPTSP